MAEKQAPPKKNDSPEEVWFFSLEPKLFIQYAKEWNERNLDIKLKRKRNYDEWLNYFKTMPASHIKILAATAQDLLPTEGYAALARWHDIISNPARIDKIHQAGLTNKKRGKLHKSIVQLAQENDRLGVLKATRDQIAEKLEKGAGARDTAALAREMTEVMTQIADYEKRLGPKKETMLGQLLDDMPETVAKRPAKNGGGSRNTSFKSRVTIDDVEDK
jgi:hypothetical protein